MDSDYRPHRTTSINSTSNTTNSTTTATTSSELFICFTSRLSSSSSSSMKISSSASSKSILSPGRSHSTPQISLSSSSSLSRRLKNSGSLKGGLGQGSSPMFPTTKKRGCGGNAFENPEPSSPKVTCIGQVRVKTKKKHAKKLRSSRSSSHHKGEVSFRKLENVESIGQEGLGHRNQRWVHFPVSICEALRSFGADLNCFLPCMNGGGGERSKEDKLNGSGGGHSGNSSSNCGSSSSCGAVIARWLVALHDGDGKGREIELVVGEEGHGGFGGGDEEEVMEVSRRSQRRHIFEGLDFSDEMMKKGHGNDEEEKGRVSISIPPKNALLLMRCRSDPVKMAALANKFCGSPQPGSKKDDEEGDKDESFEDCVEEEDDKDENFEACEDKIEEEEEIENDEKEEEGTAFSESEKWVLVETREENKFQEAESSLVLDDDGGDNEEKEYDSDALEEIIVNQIVSIVREEELGYRNPKEEELEADSNDSSMPDRERLDLEGQESEENSGDCNDIASKTEQETEESMGEAVKVMEEKETCEEPETQVKTTRVGSEFNDLDTNDGGPDTGSEPKNQQEKEKPILPDCLLLMMYEPKLSMEVSKETWVCSTDFVRFLPDRSAGKISSKMDGGDELKKKVKTECRHPYPALTTQQTRILQQPPRNSCSFPAQAVARGTGKGVESMAAVIEQKLVNAKAYEPFVLTRCKSEPMRSAIKLAPDACFWKNRKHEPHRSGRIRVKAAGVGF